MLSSYEAIGLLKEKTLNRSIMYVCSHAASNSLLNTSSRRNQILHTNSARISTPSMLTLVTSTIRSKTFLKVKMGMRTNKIRLHNLATAFLSKSQDQLSSKDQTLISGSSWNQRLLPPLISYNASNAKRLWPLRHAYISITLCSSSSNTYALHILQRAEAQT